MADKSFIEVRQAALTEAFASHDMGRIMVFMSDQFSYNDISRHSLLSMPSMPC
jgi:hypothetical protein